METVQSNFIHFEEIKDNL